MRLPWKKRRYIDTRKAFRVGVGSGIIAFFKTGYEFFSASDRIEASYKLDHARENGFETVAELKDYLFDHVKERTFNRHGSVMDTYYDTAANQHLADGLNMPFAQNIVDSFGEVVADTGSILITAAIVVIPTVLAYVGCCYQRS